MVKDNKREGSIMSKEMKNLDWVHVIGGCFIVGSLALGHWVNAYWYLFTAFIGLNFFQFGFTGFCPMAVILKKCGVK